MRATIAQVSLATKPMSVRPSRLIQIRITAIGCRMQSSSSMIFFVMRQRYPLGASRLHLGQGALARGLVVAPAQDLGAVADAAVRRVVKRDLDDELGAQRD